MADTKLPDMTEISVITLDDILYTVDDPAGTPLDRKVSLNRLLGLLNHVCQGRLTLATGHPCYTPHPATPASTDTTADTVTFSLPHGWVTGTMVTPETTVGGLTAGNVYYINATSTTTVSFHATLANAEAGTSKTNLSAPVTSEIWPYGVQSTTLRFAPNNGNLVSLYDGTRWKLYAFTEVSLALGTLIANQAYDVFLYDNSGTLTLEILEWANATVTMTIATPCVVTWTDHGLKSGQFVTFATSGALPTGVSAATQYYVTVIDKDTFNISTTLANQSLGTLINTSGSQSGTHTGRMPYARATALTTQDGVLVKSGATTRRYVGSFYATTTACTEDSSGGKVSQVGAKRHVWNCYGRIPAPMFLRDITASWSYSTTTPRSQGGAFGNRFEAMIGLDDVSLFEALSYHSCTNSTSTARTVNGQIMEDNVSLRHMDGLFATFTITNVRGTASAHLRTTPSAGFHMWILAENGNGTDTQTWSSSSTTRNSLGMIGSVEC